MGGIPVESTPLPLIPLIRRQLMMTLPLPGRWKVTLNTKTRTDKATHRCTGIQQCCKHSRGVASMAACCAVIRRVGLRRVLTIG